MPRLAFASCFFAAGFLLSLSVASAGADAIKEVPSLKTKLAAAFDIGFGTELVTGPRAELVRHHASTLTCENSLKPTALQPRPDTWAWRQADEWVAWAETLGVKPVGHTLVWCYRQPGWLLERIAFGQLTREQALRWQDEYIRAVLGRYGDRIHTWDVVNEALSDSAEHPFLRSDPWTDLCGEDYIIEAFRSARAAAPQARLLYNDYNLELPEKRARLLRLLKRLEAAGCRPDGVGIQAHYSLSNPPAAGLEAAIQEIHAAGYPVSITELDISVYRWVPGANLQNKAQADASPVYETLPEDVEALLREYYTDIFRVLLRHREKIDRVTFWNIDDGNTWLRTWPIRGRPNHPLLFDADHRPKPVFWAVLKEIAAADLPHGAP